LVILDISPTRSFPLDPPRPNPFRLAVAATW
jgi:hypothetical protein